MSYDFTQIGKDFKAFTGNEGKSDLDFLKDITEDNTDIKFGTAKEYAAIGGVVGTYVPFIGNAIGAAGGWALGFGKDNWDKIDTWLTGGGGNTGNNYPYLEAWRYMPGGPNYGQKYTELTTNKNYYNTDFSKFYKPIAERLGISLPQLIKEFKTVINNNPYFFKDYSNDTKDDMYSRMHKNYLQLQQNSNNSGGSVSSGANDMVAVGGNRNTLGFQTQVTPFQQTENNTQKSPIAIIGVAIIALFLIFK
jgi:hypothetical protein